ncbi:chromate resistance protein ChrB domain-containing protein [Caenimonas terrae]|uniref:Chromate resistance protein ChrB domain-containing protein n=1 Tax=Caenimonas terrae TaxID=696074 RepID=A0ABW0N9P1_9BURK
MHSHSHSFSLEQFRRPSRWITRERPKIDRIACPWLVLRFIDPQAQFIYVPTDKVMAEAARLDAVAYDIPGAPITHEGELCSFDALKQAFGLHDPGLATLATIVRGADTARLELAPQSAGLLALSLGLSRLHDDDHAMLAAALPMYDALYAWCKWSQGDSHGWNPASPRPAGPA